MFKKSTIKNTKLNVPVYKRVQLKLINGMKPNVTFKIFKAWGVWRSITDKKVHK